MNILIQLFYVFAKIGLFTFGGGYAMIAMIEDMCVKQKEWITHDEMMTITVIAESTPGPIAINAATYVGYKKAGIKGAIISTLGIIVPSFIIIYIISLYMDQFLDIKLISSAFMGIKIAVGLIILEAGIKMIKKMKKSVMPLSFMLISFIVMISVQLLSVKFSSLTLMVLASILSISIAYIKKVK